MTRCIRWGALALALVAGWVQAQTQNGSIAFSVLDGTNIVHVTQIELQASAGVVTTLSAIAITQRSELRISAGSALTRTLVVGNETAQTQEFSVALLLDDAQVEFSLDGRTEALHRFSLEANQQKRGELRFPALSEEELHNFVLVVFYVVELGDTVAQGIFTPYADSLLVGGEAAPDASAARPADDAFLQGQPVSLSAGLPPRGLSLSTSQMPDAESDLLASPLRLRADQAFSYFVHVRNGMPRQGEVDEFVVIALLDGVQIPIDSSADVPVAYFTLPRNGLATIPARLKAPNTPGEHTLDVLAIRNPYEYLLSRGSLETLHTRLILEVN